MSEKLYHAPLSTYCQKVYLAMYEKDIQLEMHEVNLMDEASHQVYKNLYPLGKVPLLVKDNDYLIPESSIIVEYLDDNYEKGPKLIPENKEDSRRVRFFDRMYDLYLNDSLGTIMLQDMKKEGQKNQEIIDKSIFRIKTLYGMMEEHLSKTKFAYGNSFSMADCALIPCLFYALTVMPFDEHENICRYFSQIKLRPSVDRLFKEIEPIIQKIRHAG